MKKYRIRPDIEFSSSLLSSNKMYIDVCETNGSVKKKETVGFYLLSGHNEMSA
jgi:hypothetical protein